KRVEPSAGGEPERLVYHYSSPFARPAESGGAEPESPPGGPVQSSAPASRAFAGAAVLLLVLLASVAGAVIAHEFWPAAGSPSAAPAGGGAASFGRTFPGGSGGPSNPAAIAAKVSPALVDVDS